MMKRLRKELVIIMIDKDLKEILDKVNLSRIDKLNEITNWELEQKKIIVSRIIENSNIPKLYVDSSFENFKVTKDNKNAFESCKRYVANWDKNNGESLAIFGDIGVGKTHLAIAICHKLINDYQVHAKYASTILTFEMARESFNGDGVNPLPILRGSELLIFDDLGSERPSSWTLEQISIIIEHRVGAKLPMIITSNANNWAGIVEMLSHTTTGDGSYMIPTVERIVDRLRSVTGEISVIRGNSWRGQPKIMRGGDNLEK